MQDDSALFICRGADSAIFFFKGLQTAAPSFPSACWRQRHLFFLVMPEGAVIAERRDFVVNVLGERGEGVGGVRIAGPGRHIDRGFVAEDVDLLAWQNPIHLVDSWNKKIDLVFPVVFLKLSFTGYLLIIVRDSSKFKSLLRFINIQTYI